MVAAEEAKVAALAKADEDKAACDEGNTNARAEMEQKIADIELKDRVREEAIKDEIKETAEKLLKINEQIQEHLTALTQL
jgi:septin family protein